MQLFEWNLLYFDSKVTELQVVVLRQTMTPIPITTAHIRHQPEVRKLGLDIDMG